MFPAARYKFSTQLEEHSESQNVLRDCRREENETRENIGETRFNFLGYANANGESCL